MKLSYHWLKELVTLRESPEKLAEILDLYVAQVEKIERSDQGLDNVIVAEIMEIKAHPNADKLQIAIVKTWWQKEEVLWQIVCGAPNIRVGQKVPLALPGASLPNGMKIQKSTIRGVESMGMLCAEDELGVGPDHTGIYILPSNVKLGESIKAVMGLDDVVFEIENKSITHRPDLFSHLGFAREIAVLKKSKVKSQKPLKIIKSKKGKVVDKKLNIKVEDHKLCPRYMAAILDNVVVKPSPPWMQNRLKNLGIRPINNIVDITNYILLELGQPLHAFDYHKLNFGHDAKQNTIFIRGAKEQEKLLTLDGNEQVLCKDDLVIADSQRAIALAGVMGGEYSGVNNTTKTVVIESALFNSANIRRTSWRLGLRTEAVLRLEKGLPIVFPELGIKRAIELIQELAGGRLVGQIYDIKSLEAARALKKSPEINFDYERVRELIGAAINDQEITKILSSIGCKIKKNKKKVMVSPPIYRPDLNIFEDLVEEIVRFYGVEKVVSQPILSDLSPVLYNQEFLLERDARQFLVGAGFDEVYNYSFVNSLPNQDKKIYIELENPLDKKQPFLRVSLISRLLENVLKNISYYPEIKIFEIGKIFRWSSEQILEQKRLAGIIFGHKKDKKSYQDQPIFQAKGIIELFFSQLNPEILPKLKYELLKTNQQASLGWPNIQRAVAVILENELMAVIGELGLSSGNSAVESGDLIAGAFEINLEKLSKIVQLAKQYRPISSYPEMRRDLAFLINSNIQASTITDAISQADPLVQQVDLFDAFEDARFAGKKSVAFHIIYRAPNRTLTSEEINKIQDKIINKLKEQFNAELRSF